MVGRNGISRRIEFDNAPNPRRVMTIKSLIHGLPNTADTPFCKLIFSST